MLCALKVRRSQAADEEAAPYRLQISAKHAVGGAAGLISDEHRYPTLPDLLQALSDLQLPGDLLLAGKVTAELEKAEDRWLPVATDLQIPFELLMMAGFSLDDLNH